MDNREAGAISRPFLVIERARVRGRVMTYAGGACMFLALGVFLFAGTRSVSDEFGNEVGQTFGGFSVAWWIVIVVLALGGFVLFGLGQTREKRAEQRSEEAEAELAERLERDTPPPK